MSKHQSNPHKLILIILALTFSILVIIAIVFLIISYTPKEEFTIVEESDSSNCAMAIEEFYRDDEYTYSFPCIMSDNFKVIFHKPNQYEEDLKTALREKHINIEDLDRFNINYIKEPIATP